MNNRVWAVWACACMLAGLTACSRRSARELELKRYPLDNLEGLIHLTGVEVDSRIKTEGSGSLRLAVTEPSVIRLFESGDIDIEDANLFYKAKIRTENAQGNVYLEMWCAFEGKGEFFSRGLQAPLKGTNDWSTEEIPFFLKKGENPSNVRINIVSEGPATIWVDDIRLVKRRS
ncbi:MAG: hypothetical protein AB1715_05530 [Acidobacteriota bacterium]